LQFSRGTGGCQRQTHCCSNFDVANEVDNLSGQYGIFYAKPLIYTFVFYIFISRLNITCIYRNILLSRDKLSCSISRAVSLFFRLVALSTFIYRAGPSMRKRISDINDGRTETGFLHVAISLPRRNRKPSCVTANRYVDAGRSLPA